MKKCPTDTLKLEKDKDGFLTVSVNEEKCINCGLCDKVCPMICNSMHEESREVYAANWKDREKLKASSSGGAFGAFATEVLKNSGIVYGAAWKDSFSVEHIGIANINQLHLLQGSKYIQSNAFIVFSDIKKKLDDNIQVLFSGTPCQVMALRNYLKRDYSNLLLIDIVCHGVGNQTMLLKDIDYLEKKYKKKVKKISFRSKRRGWGTSGLINFSDGVIDYNITNSPYYYFFLNASIFRESCYRCPFANGQRVSDITIGDYWGIENAIQNSSLTSSDGVSCIIINTRVGSDFFEKVHSQFNLEKTTFKMIQMRNGQLVSPSKKSSDAEKVLELYRKGGADLVKYWKRISASRRIMFSLKELIPETIKKKIKRLFAK